MNKELFVQNIKKYCSLRGVKPTVACRESGVSSSFISNIEGKNQIPSVEKVQMLANYLGVTTSELLGEKKPTPVSGDGLNEDEQLLMNLVEQLTPDQQRFLVAWLKTALSQEP